MEQSLPTGCLMTTLLMCAFSVRPRHFCEIGDAVSLSRGGPGATRVHSIVIFVEQGGLVVWGKGEEQSENELPSCSKNQHNHVMSESE